MTGELVAANRPNSLSFTKPIDFPAALTRRHQVDNFRGPLWLAHPLPDGERGGVRAILAALDQRFEPCTKEFLALRLKAMFLHYQMRAMSESALGEDKFLRADYARLLLETGLSAAHLCQAIDALVRSSNWRPKVAEIQEEAEKLAATDGEMRRRARVLLDLESPRPFEVPRPSDDGKPRDMARVLASLPKRLGGSDFWVVS